MSGSSLCADFICKIDNILYCYQDPYKSEQFIVDTLDHSSWFLSYYPKSGDTYLYRAKDDKVTKDITVNIEISVLDTKNEPHHVNEILCKTYSRGFRSFCTKTIPLETVRNNAEKYLNNKVFTIRCRMWLPGNELASRITLGTLQTQIPVRECSFNWKIEAFSQSTSLSGKMIRFDSISGPTESLVVVLSCVKHDGEIHIKREITGKLKENTFLKCDISIPITNECYISEETILISTSIIDLIKPCVPQKKIIENANQYLFCDTLLLNCKVAIICHDLNHSVYTLTLCKTQPFSNWYKISNTNSQIRDNGNISIENISHMDGRKICCHTRTLKRDTLQMYRESTMSDFSIQVGNKIIPVHATILASRSLVFRRMLETDMAEKNDKILKLDNLDEATVNQMLEYIYSDDPGELNAESALKLYYVADQYQLSGLKEISALCLKQNVSLTNVCEIFGLADQHNDADLKSFAIQFICVHEKEVILSEKFETLSASNHKLCLNILKDLTKLRLG